MIKDGKTNIIATVGPACGNVRTLAAVISAGAGILRINASHSRTSDIPKHIRLIRKAARKAGKPVSILLDLQGPRLRTGRLQNGKPVLLQEGQDVIMMTSDKPGDGYFVTTDCPGFEKMVQKGERIFLDHGMIKLRVLRVQKQHVYCAVNRGGSLGERKGMNLPDTTVRLPILSPKDQRDLKAGALAGIDWIAVSFVRNADDIKTVRRILNRTKRGIPLMAKIERPEAVANLYDILHVADAVMVARGDLGIELGVEKVPFIQKVLINQSNQMGLPVVTATQMLESMIEQPYPTRAEVSDIANAVLEGSDAVMLSGETAAGKYPVESVKLMARIVQESEAYMREVASRLFRRAE